MNSHNNLNRPRDDGQSLLDGIGMAILVCFSKYHLHSGQEKICQLALVSYTVRSTQYFQDHRVVGCKVDILQQIGLWMKLTNNACGLCK
jgi:hypothetical protein